MKQPALYCHRPDHVCIQHRSYQRCDKCKHQQKYQLADLRRKQGYRWCFWSRVTDCLLGTAIHMQIHPQPRFHCIPASSFDQLCCCGWAGLELFNASVCAGGDLRLMTRSYCKTLHMHVSWYIDNSSYICIYIYMSIQLYIYIHTYLAHGNFQLSLESYEGV